MKKLIVKILNILYIAPIARMVPKQTFYYAVCGGGNMVLDICIYTVVYNFILEKNDLTIFNYIITSEIASFLITFPIILITGLWLSKNITFTNSRNSDKKQIIRYFTVTIANIFIKSFGIKLLVSLAVWPSFANAAMTVVTVLFSYLMQKYYTFRGNVFKEGN